MKNLFFIFVKYFYVFVKKFVPIEDKKSEASATNTNSTNDTFE